MRYYFGNLMAVWALLLIVVATTSCRWQRLALKEELRQREKVDSSFTTLVQGYSLSHSVSGDSLNAEVLLWPEGAFRYSIQEGYTGHAKQVEIRYRQQRSHRRQDSQALYSQQEALTRRRAQQQAFYTERRYGQGLNLVVIGALLVLLLLASALIIRLLKRSLSVTSLRS